MSMEKKHIIICVAGFIVLAPLLLLYAPGGMAPPSLAAAEGFSSREMKGLIDRFMEETDGKKRQELVQLLRSYPEDEVGTRWLELLDGAVRVSTTVRVIDGMAEFADRRFVPPLARLLVSPHYAIRKSAARTLKKTGDDRLYPVILGMVNSRNPVHRIYFIEAMNYLYDRRFYQSLTGLLRDDNKSIRIYVINCLKENRITESLGYIRAAAMNDGNDEVRIAAIEAIGDLRDGIGLGVLHATLNDENRDVRCESVRSIGRINSFASVNALSLRMAQEDENEIKEMILDILAGLARVGDVRGIEKVLRTDAQQGLRIKAAHVLGFSASPLALAALRDGIGDTDFRVRAEVCNSLGNFRNRQSLAVLLEVLGKEDHVYVKSAALYSIRRINDRKSLIDLFDFYTEEKDPIFRELLRITIREYIGRYI